MGQCSSTYEVLRRVFANIRLDQVWLGQVRLGLVRLGLVWLGSYLSLFICYLSHFIGYLTTSYLVYHCSYLDEHPFFNFISWRTCPKKLHILFINLQLFTNIPLKTSYVDEQCLKIPICYFSCFSSYLSLTSYLDEHLPLKFIAYFTEFSCYLSLFIAYLSISYLDELICYLALFSS